MASQKVVHELKSVFDSNSKILILGTMPSPKSREFGFYYSHPQNRFWKVLPALFGVPPPVSSVEKTDFLIRHGIAMWDVLRSCVINGADDSSISEAEPNDIETILRSTEIRAIFTTGKKATDLYRRLCQPSTGRPSIYLPSTSPANCRNQTMDSLTEAYRIILEYLDA
jgi:hypoxanthine-DNA glycosylase